MEIIGALAGFFVAFLVVSALLQVTTSYSLQVLSEKNELPEFAAFLSWIPLLNLYPAIRCGGGDFRKFVLGIVGFVVLAGASAAASAGLGALVGAALLGLLSIGALGYFASLAMRTAELRGLSKWVGLLMFVPVVNLGVYPYIAFHDGFRPPHKIGVAIGLLIAFGPIPGNLAMLRAMAESGSAYEAALSSPSDFGGIEQLASLADATPELLEIASLGIPDPQIPAQRIASPEALAGPAPATTALLEAAAGSLMDVAATNGPAASTPPLTDSIVRQGDFGFDVPTLVPCPAGTKRSGASPPGGTVQWCARPGGGLRHGWFTEWHENAQPAVAGEYQEGLRVGIWTRWHANGEKRAQAEFRDGLQDGVQIAWAKDGEKIHESRFQAGSPASR